MKIYRVDTYMKNPNREIHDFYSDYDEAMSYYNGVKNNPNCESIEVTKMENSKECSLFKDIEIVASYS